VQGTVRNVVDFGAFVDIGLKNDALLHISRMGQRFVKNPHDVLGVGDILEVEIADIDLGKGRVGLAMSSN
jgi:protein Tex